MAPSSAPAHENPAAERQADHIMGNTYVKAQDYSLRIPPCFGQYLVTLSTGTPWRRSFPSPRRKHAVIDSCGVDPLPFTARLRSGLDAFRRSGGRLQRELPRSTNSRDHHIR